MCVFSSSHFTWARPLISGVTASTKTRFAQHERCHCRGTPPPQIGTPIGHRHTSSSARNDEKWRYVSATLRQHRHEPSLAIIDLTLEKFFHKPPSLFFALPPRFFFSLAPTFQATSGTNSPLPVANPTPSSDFRSQSTSQCPFFIHFGSLFLPRENLQDIFSLLATSSPHTHLSWGTSSLLSLVMMADSSTATAVLVQPGYERATSRRECRARFEAVVCLA